MMFAPWNWCTCFSLCTFARFFAFLHRFLRFFSLKIQNFTKKVRFFAFFSQKILSVQKKVVILHRQFKKELTGVVPITHKIFNF